MKSDGRKPSEFGPIAWAALAILVLFCTKVYCRPLESAGGPDLSRFFLSSRSARANSAWSGIFLGGTHPYGWEDASLLPATRRPLRFDFRREAVPKRSLIVDQVLPCNPVQCPLTNARPHSERWPAPQPIGLQSANAGHAGGASPRNASNYVRLFLASIVDVSADDICHCMLSPHDASLRDPSKNGYRTLGIVLCRAFQIRLARIEATLQPEGWAG